jgi:hypothetical protein
MQVKPGVVEAAVQIQKNKLKLLGTAPVRLIPKFKDIAIADCEFREAYGEDTKIFYALQKHNEKEVLLYERGIGKLEKDGEDYILVREKVIAFGKSPLECSRHIAKNLPDLSTTSNEFIIVTSYLPTSYLEALIYPNCIISSSENGLNIVNVPANSLVGRSEKQIEALTEKELPSIPFFISSVTKALQGFLEPIFLKCQSLTVSNVLSNVLTLKPTHRPDSPSQGTIIFNIETKNFEKFDGAKWTPF